jgi:hypothetical protein
MWGARVPCIAALLAILLSGATASANLIGVPEADLKIRAYNVPHPALGGDTAVVGDAEGGSSGYHPGHVYVFVPTPTGWIEQAVLRPDDDLVVERFGWGVAVQGDSLLVGKGNGSQVWVFTRSGGAWTLAQTLDVGAGATQRLAISGDAAIVGYPGDYCTTCDRARAWVLARTGDAWTVQQEIGPSDSTSGDAFGIGVAIQGDTAVVTSLNKHAAYVFTYANGVDGWKWREKVRLALPGGVGGNSVSISGTRFLVDNFVYASDGAGGWSLEATLVLSSGHTAWYGALDGDLAAVTDGTDVHLFTRVGSTWSEESVFPITSQPDLRIALSGRRVLAGGVVFRLGADDGDACSSPDECVSGSCVGSVCCAAATCGLAQGQPCDVGDACASGYCVDGYCCDASCVGPCNACNGADLGWAGATNGTCEIAPAGSPASDPSCGLYVCAGTNVCPTTCHDDSDCALSAYCPNAWLWCRPRAPNGANCVTPAPCSPGVDCRYCASGNCVDGVCCDTACDGECEACAAAAGALADGVCTTVAPGTGSCPGGEPDGGGSDDGGSDDGGSDDGGGDSTTTCGGCRASADAAPGAWALGLVLLAARRRGRNRHPRA